MVYKAKNASCGARKFMVDLHVWKAAGAWVKQVSDNGLPYPTEFVNDLTIALIAQETILSSTVQSDEEITEYYHDV